jgi:glycerol uptake facilitator-like aquaporin
VNAPVSHKLAAEFLGSLLLTGVVIGSGIMAARLSGGNDGIALLGNTLATAAILYMLVTVLGPLSGAHFNPAVTLVAALRGETTPALALAYVAAQVAGCVAGAVVAHAMFEQPLLQTGSAVRDGAGQLLGEGAATFALVFAILLTVRAKPEALAMVVAMTIAAGYWWTSSTSFANPAITIARALSDTFAGIRPVDAPGFIVAQCAGATLAMLVCGWIYPARTRAAQAVRTAAATRSVSKSGG